MAKPVEIHQTTIAPDGDGTSVQLYISDMPPDVEGAAIRIALTAKVPALEIPLLIQLQREAMKVAAAALSELLQRLAREVQER